jgi:hypothetical protein
MVPVPRVPEFTGKLTTNKAVGDARGVRTLAFIQEKSDLSKRYVTSMRELIDNWCELVDYEALVKSGQLYCELPTHPVVRTDSASTPVRPVMDGSAYDRGTVPLNKFLQPGPNILPVIQDVLRRFQRFPNFVIGDIKKAFMQVGIRESDRNLLLVRWWEEQEDGSWKTVFYRFKRLPWGIISAPFVLNAVVRYLYDKYAKLHPELAEDIAELKRSTYVDDILAFGKTPEEAARKMNIAVDALAAGQMQVTKFRSHPCQIADELSVRDVFSKGEPSADTFKVLGLWYQSSTDEI